MATQWLRNLTNRWTSDHRCGNGAARNRRRADRPVRLLAMERLEERSLLSTTGVPWADAKHLSLSFAPDGTSIAAHRSDLFQTLDATEPSADWEREVLRAFQTWAVQTDINISLAADNGDPFGTPGRIQGDPRFGDIRVGAQRMSREVLSISVPHDRFIAGTWTGDVLLNSAYSFNSSTADLFSTMLHEAGHVFGLDHSTDPQSVMFSHSGQLRTGLTQGDIARIQSLYGVRSPDALETDKGNDSFSTATRIRISSQRSGSFDGSMPLVLFGDITTPSDVDVFSLRPFDKYQGSVTFRLQTAGVSLLAPRLKVFDESGRVLGQSESNSAGGSVLTVRLTKVDPRATYYARVEGASSDVFGIGAYGLAVTFDTKLTVPQTAIDTVLRGPYQNLPQDAIDQFLRNPSTPLFNDDLHSNDTFSTATDLRTTQGYASNTHFEVSASISDCTDVDFYRIRSPDASDQALTLTAAIRAPGLNGTVPRVTVLDADRNLVDSEVLTNGNGTYTIQAANAKPNTDYYVVVGPERVSGTGSSNYILNIDFQRAPTQLRTFASSSLSESAREVAGTLYIAQTQLFQFALSASATAAAPDASVQMIISDQNGNRIFELSAPVGETVSCNSLLLTPGAYSIEFVAATSNAAPLPLLAFRLGGASISDPIGPGVEDPTLDPVYTCPNDPAAFCYPGGAMSPDPFNLGLLPVA